MLGIVLGLISGLFFAAGNLIQKRSVDRLKRFSLSNPVSTIATLVRSWMWILGALLSVLGVLILLAAYRETSIAVVQAMAGVGIIVLLTFPRVLFRERMSKREAFGAILALASFGLVVASIVGHPYLPKTHLMTSRVELAIIATVAMTAILVSLTAWLNLSTAAIFGLGSGLLYGAVGLGVKGASAAFTSAGLAHGIGQLFGGPIPYSLLVSWVAALLLFQVGIQRGRLSIVAPLSGVVSTIFVIAVGTPLYNEQWPTSTGPSVIRIVGLVAIVCALALVLVPGPTFKEAKNVDQVAPPAELTDPALPCSDRLDGALGPTST